MMKLSENEFLFTSESVTEGHPDKIADQISDAVLDAVLAEDPTGRVACETLTTTGLILVAGEITTNATLDFARIARDTVRGIGYDDASMGFDCNTCSVVAAIDEQSPDIAQGVDEAYESRQEVSDRDPHDLVGAGDQGMMFGYATNETPELMPMPIMLAHQLAQQLATVRKSGALGYLRPDGKTQVTVRYENDHPVEIERVLISTQHGPEVDSQQRIRPDLFEQIVLPVLPGGLYDEAKLLSANNYLVNPTGKFVVGGPMGDCGLTGRKIIVDTYGGFARHGGGAFSGKDPSKVDRSAAYAARYVAKNVVAAGLADRCEVQVAYAIGVARPVSVMAETFGTEHVPKSTLLELIAIGTLTCGLVPSASTCDSTGRFTRPRPPMDTSGGLARSLRGRRQTWPRSSAPTPRPPQDSAPSERSIVTGFPTDLDIARQARLLPPRDVAADIGLPPSFLEPYGEYVAKIKLEAIEALAHRPRARYVVVSAITPTPLGEGKTTTTVGLGQAFRHIGKKATIAIRQPSMGPTFGIKGGAAGGGYSQVVPMELLNLHLTGDMHAVTAAHNLLAAMIDNHIHQGDDLGIEQHSVTWRRVLDVNDRVLRTVVVGLGSREDGIPRQTGFDITAASEAMAVLALSTSLQDMRRRLGRIVVGYSKGGDPISAEDLKAAGAMTVIMREAIKPNLLQTLENTPVLVHAGPFGNIAHGNSSVVADLIGIHTGDFLVTEAGFGADMGAERFFNIKCRASGLRPDAAVLVTTVRALKAHSGRHRVVAGRPLPDELLAENPDEVHMGGANLEKQIENISLHGVTPVVAINAFPTDHPTELRAIAEIAERCGARSAVANHFAKGGKGAIDLAEAVADAAEEPSDFGFLYRDDASLREKIETVATRVYGAAEVKYDLTASRQIDTYERAGFGRLPVCIAKTHLSISSDPKLKGAPRGWVLPVREVRASVGAGFIYPICGDMRTMPGLASHPAAEHIDIDEHGELIGLS